MKKTILALTMMLAISGCEYKEKYDNLKEEYDRISSLYGQSEMEVARLKEELEKEKAKHEDNLKKLF